MKRTLLIGTLLALAVVGGAVKEDRITILRAKVLRLPVPTQGYQPYTRGDVVLISDSAKD
jgi:hypothetical protein